MESATFGPQGRCGPIGCVDPPGPQGPCSDWVILWRGYMRTGYEEDWEMLPEPPGSQCSWYTYRSKIRFPTYDSALRAIERLEPKWAVPYSCRPVVGAYPALVRGS